MGYSLAPAPDTQVPSLSGNSRAVSPSISKGKSFQPRAELAPIPSRIGEEVTEIVSFLNSVEPPKQPETHLYSTNSKLKKSTLGTLWRIGRFSTKRQEQLRAALPKPTRDEETIAGAKYLHIAVDPSAFKSSGNLSMYRANEYRDPAQKRMTVSLTPTVPSETPTAVETTDSSAETPTIPKSQSFQLSDALGISREYPHLISGDPKTKAGRKAGKHGANTVSSSDTLVPRYGKDVSITKDFAIHSSNVRFELIPAESLRGRELVSSGSTNSSVLDLNVVPPQSSSRSLRRTFNRQIGPTAIEVVTESAQLPPNTARSSQFPRRLSRPSVRSVSDGLPTPLPRDSQSTRSSMQSASESLDILSDTSSGIVLSAQSAEYMRPQGFPGYHSSTSLHKPPKPAPAPTRSLPLLREGQDGITMIHRPSFDTRSPPLRIEPSPEPLPMKFPSPPKSPSKHQRHSHHDAADNNHVAKASALVKSATAPQPHWPLSSNPPFSPPINRSTIQPTDSHSPINMNSETLAAWRRRRVSATKALKRRDLERGRVRRTSRKSPDLITVIDPSDPTDPIAEPDRVPSASKHTDTPRSDASASEEDTTRPRLPPTTTSSYRRRQTPRHSSTHVSPVMLVAAQSPGSSPKRTSWLSIDAHQGSTSAPTNSLPELERERKLGTLEHRNPSHPSDSNSPSHPSSDEEGPERSRTASCSGARTQARRKSRPQSMAEPDERTSRGRYDGRYEGTGRTKSWGEELEERMEARLAAVERKNLLLEAALLAVINASAGFSPAEGGRARGRREGSGRPRGGEGLEARLVSVLNGTGGL